MKEDLFLPHLPFRMVVPIEVRFRDMDAMIVAEAACPYRAPIRVGEIRQKIERPDTGQGMALGRSVQVSYDYARGAPVPIPEPWRERMRRFEEGLLGS